jgi:hypothetical protein
LINKYARETAELAATVRQLRRIDYDRWPPVALALSQAFYDLPWRRGTGDLSTHDIGIERLRLSSIRGCLDLMLRDVDVFEYQPTADEVERIGRELHRMDCRLDKIVLDHRRIRQEAADRNDQTD